MSEVAFCSRCGTPRRPGGVFCSNCGARFEEGGATPEPVAGQPSASQELPPLAPPPPPPLNLPLPPPPAPVAHPSDQQPTQVFPPAVPGAAPAPAPARPASAGLKATPLALVGGLAVAVASFLPWLSGRFGSPKAFDIPFNALYDLEGGSGGLKLGVAILIVGAGSAALAFVPKSSGLRRLGGGLALAMVVAFVVQLIRALNPSDGGAGGDVFTALGVGVYVAAAGGALLTAGK